MSQDFENEFNALVSKAAELLTGDGSSEMSEKIKIWAVYQHLHKAMPALTNHWNGSHPDAKAQVRAIFEEIRDLNERQKANRGKPE
ncbi:DUF2573 family protein [Paenibacillus sp. GbtcB18]|uniref:DUF2573 family protein n=1 Tax=Paenibacillus TaxID=44249 RepID=UPI001C2F5126|nr:DUF2573 family protein [Paenibacillus sp. GbtcB18]